MEIVIRQIVSDPQSVTKQVKVTSLILEYDKDRPKDVKLFYCPKCRNAVFKYNGHLSWIIPGDVPAILPSYHECRECKSQYMLVKMI